MNVEWSESALADLLAIQRFIAADNPRVARAFADRLITIANSLEHLPRRGRPGRAPHTLELVVPGTPYIVVYRSVGDEVEIISIDHAARRA